VVHHNQILDGDIVLTEHNTVFARSGQLSEHKLFTCCIGWS